MKHVLRLQLRQPKSTDQTRAGIDILFVYLGNIRGSGDAGHPKEVLRIMYPQLSRPGGQTNYLQ